MHAVFIYSTFMQQVYNSKSATDATTETAPPSPEGKTILSSLTLCYVKGPPCHNCQRAHTREIKATVWWNEPPRLKSSELSFYKPSN